MNTSLNIIGLPSTVTFNQNGVKLPPKGPAPKRPLQTHIKISLRVEGVHCWPGCPFDLVGYLRAPHRHLFWITATKIVKHDDRDIEIIMLKHRVEQYLLDTFAPGWNDPGCPHARVHEFGSMSCEMIARLLLEKFDFSTCEVLEDGENGATVIAYES